MLKFIFESYDVIIVVFDYLSDYVVDEMVFILDIFGFESFFVLGVVEFLEDVFEVIIVFFENGVFGVYV